MVLARDIDRNQRNDELGLPRLTPTAPASMQPNIPLVRSSCVDVLSPQDPAELTASDLATEQQKKAAAVGELDDFSVDEIEPDVDTEQPTGPSRSQPQAKRPSTAEEHAKLLTSAFSSVEAFVARGRVDPPPIAVLHNVLHTAPSLSAPRGEKGVLDLLRAWRGAGLGYRRTAGVLADRALGLKQEGQFLRVLEQRPAFGIDLDSERTVQVLRARAAKLAEKKGGKRKTLAPGLVKRLDRLEAAYFPSEPVFKPAPAPKAKARAAPPLPPKSAGSRRPQARAFSSSSSAQTEQKELEKYHRLSDETMDSLTELLEEVIEDGEDSYADWEVEYSRSQCGKSGVLTLKAGGKGTYVVNKQPPNKQIWLSSPLSGPKRYDWDDTKGWTYARDGSTMPELLSEELGLKIEGEESLALRR